MCRFPKISLTVIGRAMLEVSARGNEIEHGAILENRDILMYGNGYSKRVASQQEPPTTIGMAFETFSFRISITNSNPSITGIIRSKRINDGLPSRLSPRAAAGS